MRIRYTAVMAALLLVSACGHSSGTASTTAPASGSLQNVKYRVPLYPNNITKPAEPGIEPGIYQYQTSDSVLTVVAWYKSHIPSDLGGKWTSSDPSGPADITNWSYAVPGNVQFSVDVEHAVKGVPIYAGGTKTIVEVVDR